MLILGRYARSPIRFKSDSPFEARNAKHAHRKKGARFEWFKVLIWDESVQDILC
jgi:hypothetical protein